MSDTSIGARIRAARNRRGLTQGQLATIVGVAQRTIGNWERGATVPRSKTVELESLFGISLAATSHVETIRADDDIVVAMFAKFGAETLPDKVVALNRIAEDLLTQSANAASSESAKTGRS